MKLGMSYIYSHRIVSAAIQSVSTRPRPLFSQLVSSGIEHGEVARGSVTAVAADNSIMTWRMNANERNTPPGSLRVVLFPTQFLKLSRGCGSFPVPPLEPSALGCKPTPGTASDPLCPSD
ncbi:hypothetical protein AAFF_G00238040 [Aldrovandia affinis]|uniref:Uncharacterized protein n=1 Tax=Aldrovandia affinis TaxID=143900 RepID=A0AAD7W4I0_9TELE|nr:hypothetical protein AAFF_G00238040 [Aldrovandia affinis]